MVLRKMNDPGGLDFFTVFEFASNNRCTLKLADTMADHDRSPAGHGA